MTIIQRLLFSIFCLCCAAPLAAQDMFRESMESSSRMMRSSVLPIPSKRIAKFKYDALEYLRAHKQVARIGGSTDWLDHQAFFLTQFLECYQILLNEAPDEARQRAIRDCFMRASLENDLFGDEDEVMTLRYLKKEKEYTPFSLDSNWVKAFEQVQERLSRSEQKRIEQYFRDENIDR